MPPKPFNNRCSQEFRLKMLLLFLVTQEANNLPFTFFLGTLQQMNSIALLERCSTLPLLSMDVEKNQRGDAGDETVQSGLVQDTARNSSAENAHHESNSNQKFSTFSTGGQKNPWRNAEENGTAKRPLPEPADESPSKTNVSENKPVSKRLKLTSAKHTGENEGKPSNATVGDDYMEENSHTCVERAAINACPSRDEFLSKAPCGQRDFKPDGGSIQEVLVANEHSQEDPKIPSEFTSSVQDDETSVSCIASSIEKSSKCNICDEVFSTHHDLEKHVQESHLQNTPEEHTNFTHKSECASSLQMHTKQAPGQRKLYYCELCGFQSLEEDLLQAHILSKTHLRRQNLAARGGFVKMLTKHSFRKKQKYSVKDVRKKSVMNKLKIRNTDSGQLRSSSNKVKSLKTSSQLFVGMVPAKIISAEATDNVTSTEVLSCHVDGNRDIQTEKWNILASSECNREVQEPSEGNQETTGNLNTTRLLDRFQQKRSILSRRLSFKQSGTFRLNRQIKRRYHLLAIGKRRRFDSSLKHSVRVQFTQRDLSQVSPKVLHVEGDVNPLCSSASEMQELNPDKTNVSSLINKATENSSVKAVDSQQFLHPCIQCGCSLQNTKGLELVNDKEQTEELTFHCQTCGSSSAIKEDFQQHCQKSSHLPGGCKTNCRLCSFLAPNDISLTKHMCDEHGMSLHCSACHLYFLSEEEMAAHNTTQEHIGSVSHKSTFEPLSKDVALQTTACSATESSIIPEVACDAGIEMQQEDPQPIPVPSGSDFKESVLSRTQFQCRKCFYKTRSSSVLTRHIKLWHAQEYHFLCKACNLYSLSKEGMEKHIKRSKHLENARKNNIGLRFEECIERVCVGASDGKKLTEPSIYGGLKTVSENENVQAQLCTMENVSRNKELFPSEENIKGGDLALRSPSKRGRPKGTVSRTCPHCGLLASSVTNLTVHIRRKHSHQYSYLCKVCNYYTVTKGDMERHCATKKHKGRLEAHGNQDIEIIVCPEGDNVKANSKKIRALNKAVDCGSQCSHLDTSVMENQADEQSSAIHKQAENKIQLPELDGNKNLAEIQLSTISEVSNANQNGDSLVQIRPASTSGTRCAHCSFIAHSFSSLEVHVKRKHTKEFEYYCMACDYYAVTRREMIRHAETEKHKIKRQSYICTSNRERTNATDIAKETAVMSQEEHQSSEEFQIILGDTNDKNVIEEKMADEPVIPIEKKLPNDSTLESNAVSKVPMEGYAVDVEIEDGTDQSRENAADADLQGPVKIGKIITFKETMDCVLQENVGEQETVKSNFNFTTETGNQTLAFGEGSPNINFMNNNKLEEVTEKEYDSNKVSPQETKAEETQLPTLSETCSPAELQDIDENTDRAIQEMHNSSEDKSNQESCTLEEDNLIDAQREAGGSSNNTWGAGDSIAEGTQANSIEALGSFTTADDKVKEETAVQNFNVFDSSIVKLKSHEEGCEAIDRFIDGENLDGQTVCETNVKVDASQGSSGKKKKAEGHPLAESTRIRCDDCGFLADGLSGLNVHIAMKHPSKEKHFHCLLCGKSFYTESNLHQHLASAGHVRNEQASVEELPEGGATFKCVKCTEPFDSEQNLFLHIKEQHEELLREVNKYIVEDTEQINREREENKGNICKYCGKMCRSSNSMAFLAHIRTHTGMHQQMGLPILL